MISSKSSGILGFFPFSGVGWDLTMLANNPNNPNFKYLSTFLQKEKQQQKCLLQKTRGLIRKLCFMLPIEKMLISFISDSYQLISAQIRIKHSKKIYLIQNSVYSTHIKSILRQLPPPTLCCNLLDNLTNNKSDLLGNG